jgi:hypothetical protein
MKFVGLVSGGKDSVFNVIKCVAHGHTLVALANLYPPDGGADELDSFMFQCAGHTAVGLLSECLGVPMVRAPLLGGSGNQGLHYEPTEHDEVEDLLRLLQEVKVGEPGGRSLASTQRTRHPPRMPTTTLGFFLPWSPPPGALPGGGGRGERRGAVDLPAHARGERVRAAGAPVAGLPLAGQTTSLLC